MSDVVDRANALLNDPQNVSHDYYTSCDRQDCGGSCALCCLAVCKVCGHYEGALTTECPGVWTYKDHGDEVYKGKEDFRRGQWVNETSPHSPVFFREEVA